jgi:hypothetical protein
MLEIEYVDGVKNILESPVTFRLLIGIPDNNRRELFKNLFLFAEMKLSQVSEIEEWIQELKSRVEEEVARIKSLDTT